MKHTALYLYCFRKLLWANDTLLGKLLRQDRHGSILCTDECRNLYCQFMCLSDALALQDACHECTSE